MAISVHDKKDWADYYKNAQLSKDKIPCTTATIPFNGQLIFRDLFVDMDEVLASADKNKSVIVYIIADIVKMPAANIQLFNRGIFIISRRLVCNSSVVNIDFSSTNAATFMLFATEISGKLKINTLGPHSDENKNFAIADFPGLGIHVKHANYKTQLVDLYSKDLKLITDNPVHPLPGIELQLTLSSLYQFSTRLIDAEPGAARAILSWVKAASQNNVVLADLYYQSSALLGELTLEASNLNFIPQLSPAIYETLATAYLASVGNYETQYNLVTQDAVSKADQIRAGNQMLTYFNNTAAFTDSLIKQAVSNLDAAKNAYEQAQANMTSANIASMRAAADFKAGVAIWERDQTLKAAFQICMALGTFAASIGAMCVGDVAAAGATAGAVAKAGEAAAAAADSAKTVSKFATAIGNLSKAMSKLENIAKMLQNTFKFMNDLREVAKSMDYTKAVTDFEIPDSGDISSQAEWDIFRLQVDDMMRGAEGESIAGATEYRQQLDILSIYGKAQSAAQAAMVQVTQELARLYMQKKVSANMIESYKNYLNALEGDIATDKNTLHNVYVLQMNMKTYMYLAIRNYTRAYKYWALQESLVAPSILKTPAQLTNDLATMKTDYAEALGKFEPKPQNFKISEEGYSIHITDADAIAAFIKDGQITIAVGTDSELFQDMDRARVTRVQALIHGIDVAKMLKVSIRTSGVYADQYKKQKFSFSSKPEKLTFGYHEEDGKIITDIPGEISKELQAAYFQPSLFTEWTISVDKKVPRSQVNKITLSFAGSAIQTKSLKKNSIKTWELQADH
jgi:hypothetical protein